MSAKFKGYLAASMKPIEVEFSLSQISKVGKLSNQTITLKDGRVLDVSGDEYSKILEKW